jgi:hypothetical protein
MWGPQEGILPEHGLNLGFICFSTLSKHKEEEKSPLANIRSKNFRGVDHAEPVG